MTVVGKSLWVQRVGGPNVPECFVKETDTAPGTSTTFKRFDVLQVAQASNPSDTWVFFGATLTSGSKAIYVMQAPQIGPLGPLTLIATDDPVSPTVLTIGPPFIGSSSPITSLNHLFSADLGANIVFTAKATGLPPGSRQVLCTAAAVAPIPVVRSQSGLAIPTLSSGSATITGFDLAKPDQGVLSRGQAINDAGDVAARIFFRYVNGSGASTIGEGIYLGQ
jgi:hypothetical protein